MNMFVQLFWLDSGFPLISQSPELNFTHFLREDGFSFSPCGTELDQGVLAVENGTVLLVSPHGNQLSVSRGDFEQRADWDACFWPAARVHRHRS